MNTDNPREIIASLHRLGHDRNPDHPDPIDAESIDKLTLKSPQVRNMIRSYQEFFPGELDRLCLHHHKQVASHDGDIGPATIDLLKQPRCGFPDFPSDQDGLMAAKAQANWPTDCRGKLIFGRAFEAAPGLSEEDTTAAFIGAVNNIAHAMHDIEFTVTKPRVKPRHGIYAVLERLNRGVLAYSYLAQNRCDILLKQAYSTIVDWSIQFLCTVSTHELIHAMGGGHLRDSDSLMYPQIHQRSLARFGYLNESDVALMKSLGYSPSNLPAPDRDLLFTPRPWNKPKPPGPVDPGDPGEILISGGGSILVGGRKLPFTIKQVEGY